MPARRALRCLPPALFALSLLLTGCFASQERPAQRGLLPADPASRQSIAYYETQLAELPLRLRSYDLTGPNARSPVIVRDMHVLHDNVRDEILVVDSDRGRNTLWSIDAHDFTLHWKSPVEKRVNYKPVATRNYVVLMNSDGEYQAFDRMASPVGGESRLVSMGRFEGDIFPSAAPAANDTHVFVPATNNNAMRGLSLIHNARGDAPETWSFPRAGASARETFLQITLPPAADGATVAFVNNNHHLYLVDSLTGELRASCPLDGHSRTPPVIQDDMIFVGSDAGQVFAWQRSGEAAFVFGVDGLPHGRIFVEDGWIFVRTLEVYDREVPTEDGRDTRTVAAVRAGNLSAYRYETVPVPNDRSVYRVIDGDPTNPHRIDPIWTQPDVGQRVLMVEGDRVYMLHERSEEFLSGRQKQQLRRQGEIVTRGDELRVISRYLSVLDVNTGNLLRPEWDLNLIDFPFVVGSMKEHDRAIYLGTKDGYIFKAYAQGRTAGGN